MNIPAQPTSIYIGGTGRCGTNLLKEILRSHPSVYGLPFESRYLLDPGGIIDFLHRCRNWSPYIVDAALTELSSLLSHLSGRSLKDHIALRWQQALNLVGLRTNAPPYMAWELDEYIPGFRKHTQQLLQELALSQFSGTWCGKSASVEPMYVAQHPSRILDILRKFVDANIRSMLDQHNASIYVDDGTFNLLHAGSIRELSRGAKLIHVYRDPRDVVASFLQQSWTPNTVDDCVAYYLNLIDSLKAARSDVDEDTCLNVRFEDMVFTPSDTLASISRFVSVDLSDGVEYPDLDQNSVGKWKQLCRSDQSRLATLDPVVVELGYKRQ